MQAGPSISRPKLNQWSPISALRGRLSGYWIGGLPVYQAGGPPLDFEKTVSSLFGLRGSVGLIGHVHKAVLFLISSCIVRGRLKELLVMNPDTFNEAPSASFAWGFGGVRDLDEPVTKRLMPGEGTLSLNNCQSQ